MISPAGFEHYFYLAEHPQCFWTSCFRPATEANTWCLVEQGRPELPLTEGLSIPLRGRLGGGAGPVRGCVGDLRTFRRAVPGPV